mgnify:CR=1 FL=1
MVQSTPVCDKGEFKHVPQDSPVEAHYANEWEEHCIHQAFTQFMNSDFSSRQDDTDDLSVPEETEEVLKQAQAEMLDWNGTGMSVMEMSHRGKAFMSIAAKAEADLRELMSIPENYKVLFMQGGASSQFAMVPINLLGDKTSADYLLTGQWSKKAVSEAKRFCDVNVIADTSDSKFTTVPDAAELQFASDAAYVHYTPNETIGGVQWRDFPDTGDVPLVCDMSSDFVSRKIPVEKFGLIYAGAQKNLGPSGVVLAIIRDDRF